MKYYICLILLLIGTNAIATEINIEYSINTTHINSESWMNNDNKVKSIEFSNSSAFSFTASAFNNTYGNDSVAIGGGFSVFKHRGINFKMLFGVVGGYEEYQIHTPCLNDWCAYIAPSITVKTKITNGCYATVSIRSFGSAIVTSIGTMYSF